ncbi:MAG: DUF445 domain-containing protein [Firmicutes bacterium]|nr:DUF445 domain-containing protein [Alicyclobacillaceae bacterium]MCL6498219.1 DUF445 domain-containing protein [Bacillota bacterium]
MQRRWANILLAVALAVFLASLEFRHAAWARWVATAALASLAGGVADWFAVTALFRHPLGLKWLPHTAIIQENRDRIIDAIVVMVERELLSERYLATALAEVDLWEGLSRLAAAARDLGARSEVQQTLARLVAAIPVEAWGPAVGQWVTAAAEGWSASDLGVAALQWLVKSDHDRWLYTFLADQAEHALNSLSFTEEMEARLRTLIENYTRTTTQKLLLGLLESLGTIDYKELSQLVRQHLVRWIRSEAAFQQFELGLVRLMLALRDDPTVRAGVEAAKRDLLASLPWTDLLEGARRRILDAAAQGRLGEAWRQVWERGWAWLGRDPERREALVDQVRRGAVALLHRYHPWIGRLVRDNLNRMDQDEWIAKLEWYVGRDLQWIRINGTIVGGIVGVALTAILALAGIHF